ncbi:MAG TPA: alpha/beta fold hydrolase [Bryobacteraceae bacterium]|nr:alpha/beta fold hydrolase [Bryobacteraceae bacterium]
MKLYATWFTLAAVTATSVFSQNASLPASSAVKKGAVEKITVHGKSLEGNLEGDSPDRTVFVYLPPSYSTQKNRRFPVVYLLHGYGLTGERWVPFINLPDAADKDAAQGTAKEMILVSPDAFTKYSGSMYSNSPVTGDWETFIAEDLVSYIDSHYRTLATRMSRGLAGHSMGGYGTVRIGMKRPDVFSSLYIMSACCLLNNPGAGRGQAASKQPAKQAPPPNAGKGKGKGGAFGNVQAAEAAAWSPNPQNPPDFFDLPTKDGELQPAIAAKWVANSPLAMIDQYATNLKKYHAIAGDCGLQDGLFASNQQMDELFTRLGIAHTFQSYEGDHTNHVKERFEANVLPFFSDNLTFAQSKR